MAKLQYITAKEIETIKIFAAKGEVFFEKYSVAGVPCQACGNNKSSGTLFVGANKGHVADDLEGGGCMGFYNMGSECTKEIFRIIGFKPKPLPEGSRK